MSWCDEEDNFTKFWKERIERYAKTIDWKPYGEFWEETIVRQIVEAWEKKNGIKNKYKERDHYGKKYLVRWNLGVFGWNDVRSFDSMKKAKEFFDTVYEDGTPDSQNHTQSTNLAQKWEETKQIAKKRGYGCKNCNNRNKCAENDFVEFCILTEQEMPKNGFCECYWLDEKAL